MASADRLQADQPAEVARKVLRRARVSRMTFTLQNRLALANVKIKHGWENLSLDSIEPKVERALKRRRTASSHAGSVSESSSSTSDHFHPLGSHFLDSSPLAPPIFSDDVLGSGGFNAYARRQRYQHYQQHPHPHPHPQKQQPQQQQPRHIGSSASVSRPRLRTAVSASAGSASAWKSAYSLPQSSPVRRGARHARFPASLSHTNSHSHTLSFVSQTSTIPDDPASPLESEEDDDDLPLHSFQVETTHMRSSPPATTSQSPPRTPSPSPSRAARALRNRAFKPQSRSGQPGDQSGADLLLYLATSPSPAGNTRAEHATASGSARIFAPSTPPPKPTPLPSSMMSTPGGGAPALIGFGLGAGPHTPSAGFNLADFVNITPSPAQGGWARTPSIAAGAARTPLAAREARRRLNFDSLVPPGAAGSASPGLGSFDRPTGKETGLGMDLGGELVS